MEQPVKEPKKRGRKAKSEQDKKTTQHVYATPVEWSMIERAAKANNMTASTYLIARGLSNHINE